MFKKLSVATGMAITLLAVGLPVTATSAAAASCYGSTCNGRDPKAAGCASGAITLSEVNGDYPLITELRYSSGCHAVWTRVTNPLGISGVAKVIGYNASTGRFVREELQRLAPYRDEVKWTRMISSSYTTYACHRWYHSTGWQEECGRGH